MSTEPAPQKSPELERLAWSLDEFTKLAGVGKTKIYEDARNGLITLKKIGKKNLILADEGRRYLRSLPELKLPKEGEPLSEYAPAAAIAAVRTRGAA